MLITKKRHEAETEHLRDEISRLRGARMMDAETIRQQSAELEKRRSEYASLRRDYDTRGDLIAKARTEAAALRPDAEKWRDRAAREKQRGESRKKARA